MIHFTKRLLSKVPVPRGLVLVRFPWSLISVPLILLGWFHFSDPPQEKSHVNRMQSAGVVDTSLFRPGRRHRPRDSEPVHESIVQAAATDGTSDNGAAPNETADESEPSGAHDANTRHREIIVGEWEDDYQGKRHLTVKSDGTGTMVVDLDGVGKRLFAARLSFDMEWSVADGRISMKTLGGEPASKVQLVLKLYGNAAEYKILELTDERMLLLDPDGKTKYDWRRPAATAAEQ